METKRPIRGHLLFVGLALGGLALLALSAVVSGGARDARALSNCDVGDYSLDGEEMAFLSLVNDYRAQNGLGALTISTNLNRAAHWMSNDLGTNGYFSHTDSLGRSPYARAIDCGYPQGAGENLAAGSTWSSAQSAFDAWKASPGHNANMLGQYYVQIGIARVNVPGSNYTWYWTTNFGSTDDGTGGGGPAPTATATPTNTAQPPAATPTNTPTPAATNTPAPTATNTPAPAATSTPTTAGGGSSPAPTATPTATPKPATATPTPASGQPRSPSTTPTATPTATQTPQPTATPAAGSLPLSPGANLVGWPGEDAAASEALDSLSDSVAIVYRWDAATASWQRYAPGLPDYVNSLILLIRGEAYWVITR